ncbi:MAG: branched-chain amino acid ABC transporter permease [Caldilineaceae bacterium]|nr:branched-chain amino acid ABC transporter permease [Caldilineaceae bacterium]
MEFWREHRTAIMTVIVVAALLGLARLGMSANDWVVTILRGLSVGAVIFLVAAGFSIILGLMDVLNLAHGALFMLGAYITWSVYVRPDTIVDLLTPGLLLAAGFALMPVWRQAAARTPARGRMIWPVLALAAAALILVRVGPRLPISIWDPKVYQNSPIVWTQNAQTGMLASLIRPAVAEGGLPIWLTWLAVLAAGVLAALATAGLGRRSGMVRTTGRAALRSLLLFALLVGLAVLFFAFNDPLTNVWIALNSNWRFLIAVVLATLAGALLGGLMEATLVRPLYERPIYQIMLTFGLAFIGTEIVRAVWGRTGLTMPRPALFDGTGEGCPATGLGEWWSNHCATILVTIGGEEARIRTYNELFLIVVGLIVLVSVWLLLQRSRLGMIIRAGVQDGEMVEALGINVRRVFTLVFALGVGLASLGGALAAPSMGLSDAMGATLLLGALIALAIGGLTSFAGAAVGSVLVGLLQQFMIKFGALGIKLPFLAEPFKPSPSLVPASTVLLMVLVLLILPQGLFGRKE